MKGEEKTKGEINKERRDDFTYIKPNNKIENELHSLSSSLISIPLLSSYFFSTKHIVNNILEKSIFISCFYNPQDY